MNSVRRASAISSESAILLNDSMSEPISSAVSSSCLTRTEKSPRANLREAAAISSSGRAMRLEYISDMTSAAMNTAAVTTAVTPRNVDHAPSILSITFVTNT